MHQHRSAGSSKNFPRICPTFFATRGNLYPPKTSGEMNAQVIDLAVCGANHLACKDLELWEGRHTFLECAQRTSATSRIVVQEKRPLSLRLRRPCVICRRKTGVRVERNMPYRSAGKRPKKF